MALHRQFRAGALVLAVAVCAASGCGLPDALPTLPAPAADPDSTIFERFRFTVPESPGAPFVGVEVYYRLYDVNDAAELDIETREDLLERNFVRFARHDDRAGQINLPLIDQPAPGTTVTLQFDSIEGGAELAALFRNRNNVFEQVALRRGVRDDGDEFKPFLCSKFEPGDRDVSSSAQEELPGDCASKVQIQAYALSYGRTDRFTVYSDAVFLGAINLAFGS